MEDITKPPLVSVITPTLNQVEFIESTIQSVMNQDYPRIEYILMDGGSTDGTLEVLETYQPQMAHFESIPGLGQTAAINRGFSLARGSILAWLNSDDVYHPDAISSAVEVFTQNPAVGMVYGTANYINENGEVIGKFPAAQTSYTKLRRGYVHIPQQAAFLRASLWRLVGPLDPDFFFAMDYDLWVRIASFSPILHIPKVWAGFRIHRDAKTSYANDLCWPEMIKVHYRLGGTPFSIIYAKYIVRRVLKPLASLGIRWRMFKHRHRRIFK